LTPGGFTRVLPERGEFFAGAALNGEGVFGVLQGNEKFYAGFA
jgi:hypothetical protein